MNKMVKLNRKYHIRKRGTGKGKVRLNPKLKHLYKLIESNSYGESRLEKLNLSKAMASKTGSLIEVNDLGWVCRISPTGKYFASLVVEEDGSVRWYSNPDDNSDEVVKTVRVDRVKAR